MGIMSCITGSPRILITGQPSSRNPLESMPQVRLCLLIIRSKPQRYLKFTYRQVQFILF